MLNQAVRDVFDVPRFRRDVSQFAKRQGWNQTTFADATGLDRSTGKDYIDGTSDRAPTLYTAIVLCEVCDLTLSNYIKTP